MRAFVVIFVVGVLGANAQEMIRQCLCTEVDVCKEQMKESAPQCMESCKTTLNAIGDPDAMKQCVNSKREKIMQVKECVMGKIGRVCATEPGKMIPKVDMEAVQEQTMQEAKGKFENSPMASLPMFQGLKAVMTTLKEFGKCVKACVHEKGSQCITKLGCGIELPAKEQVQEAVKQCTGERNPAEIQATCECFVNQGQVSQLASICPLIGNMGSMG